jgi:branched-subunit amino acid transport protein
VNDLLVLAAAGLVTWSLRASAIVLVSGRTLPEGVTRTCGYARHAVLAALIVTAAAGSDAGPLLVTPQLIGALAAGLVAWRSGSTLWTLSSGVGAVAVAAAVWP